MSEELPIACRAVSSEEIAAQIERLLHSPIFIKSERMSTLLRYLAEQTMNGAPEKLKEYAIGVDVFQKDDSFDPRLDTTVRTEARRLRTKLEEYYRTAGESDSVEIALPKGSYRLTFQPRGGKSAPDIQIVPEQGWAGFRRYGRAAGVVVFVLVVLSAAAYWVFGEKGQPHGAIRSVVVLPFMNLSGDESRQYLADGITDGLITDLANISALRVVSRISAVSYQSRQKTAPQIGRELGVEAVLEGSMVAQGERVRVNAQLVDARTDAHLWAGAFERQEKDVLRLESDITGAITREIRVRILPDERRRLQAGRAMKPEAYDAYMKGRYFISRWTENNWHKAKEQFEEAVARDPRSALAHAGLSAAWGVGLGWAVAPHDAGPKGKQAAETALAIDPSLAEAHRELGGYYLFYAWDFPAAARELRTAVELNPENPISHEVYGYYFGAAGALDDAMREHQMAVRLNPVSLISNSDVGDIYYYQRRYDEAIQQYRRTLDLDPSFAVARGRLGRALAQNRMFASAIEELEAAAKVEPKPWIQAALGYALASASRGAEASRILGELKSEAAKRYVPPLGIAAIYIGLSNPDAALDWIEKAYQERDGDLVWLKLDSIYDLVRGHPRFQAVLKRIGLP
jgi:TolB-like protein/tetratricopeptide (TPR) repeat protein